jgi:hypothetical protein
MSVNVECISNSINENHKYQRQKCNRFVFTTNPKIAVVIITITLIISLSVVINSENFGIVNNAYAQPLQSQQQNDTLTSEDKITIQLDFVEFAPLTDSNSNQLKILVDYQTNDPSFVNTPMKGIMKVYLHDGTPLKTSSIQKGYIVGQSGSIQFATSFADKTIQKVKADVYLTNTQGSEKISNTLTIDASLER